MTVSELLDKVQYLVDVDGNQKAAVVDIKAWNELLQRLEILEDEAKWDQLFTEHPKILERLAEEAIAEYEAGKTQELDPDKL